MEGNGVDVEEEVEDSIDERHIRCHESEDGLLDDHLEGSDEVDGEQAVGVKGMFVGGRV